MLTYQDLIAVGDSVEGRINFVQSLIRQHKASELYESASLADAYYRHRNVTIAEYQKLLYTVSGKAIPDIWSANFKMACNHFHRFITQEVQYELGNGVTWSKSQETSEKLGNKKYPFDIQLQKAGKYALLGGVSFGFFNLDHIDVFSVLEFAPLYDEETGALMAGVRFWQIDNTKPMRATLFEVDGYTEYLWSNRDRAQVDTTRWEPAKEGCYIQPKRSYILKVRVSEADGEEIYDGENYPTFPIVPLWGNLEHQSELTGLREQIDCYDLIKSGFANTVDEASLIFWTIQNAGGMDDVDLAKFIERIKTVHAAVMDDQSQAESHTIEAPYESREALLDRLDKDLCRDAMALDVDNIASGAITATQIRAAYEPLNSKCDDFEYCILEFLSGILELAGIDDKATFTRSKIINATEEIQAVVQSATFLEDEYVTRKILDIFGDGDQAEEVLKRMDMREMERFAENLPPAESGETEVS